MEILGIGPSELIFIVIIAIIVLGPKDMQKAGRTIGKWLRTVVTSDGWKLFQQTSREIQTLPNRLMRDAALDELKETQRELRRPLRCGRASRSARRWRIRCRIASAAANHSGRTENPPLRPQTLIRRQKTVARMLRWLAAFWRAATFPSRALWWLIDLPGRALRSAGAFMRTDPEEHPLGEVIVDLTRNAQARQLFWDQVEALRGHLLRAVLGIVLGVGLAFTFTDRLIQFLARPVGGLGALKAIEVTESIGVFMKVALLAGIAISIPYVAFEFWLFAAPGLRPRERLYGLVGIPFAALFFVGGMAFTYYMLLPSALPFLLNFLGIQAQLRPQSYFSFVTGLMFWIGVAFEFPLLVYVITAMGFVKPDAFARQWRLAVVLIAVAAAAITPTVDPVNMGLVMLPMVLLYFISIGLSYIAYAGRGSSPGKEKLQEDSA